ncbi:MAG: N-acetyl sugar amidotransferase [Bacteroidota bacterium]
MSKKIFWCSNCLNMSTRPRITFDERGWCTACQWMELKRTTVNWGQRQQELQELVGKFRNKENGFDCIVPVSGGKDGSYVAYMLKHKYNMNPLAVTIRPALELDLGSRNLKNFIESGYDHIHVSPNAKVMQILNKYGFIEKGFPYYGWLTAILTSVIQVAKNFNIPLIVYGEDGEVEYGGSTETRNKSLFTVEYMKRVYLEGGYDKVLNIAKEKYGLSDNDLSFWKFPNLAEESEMYFTHWSYFEAWDSYRNYVVAKDHCGLEEREDTNSGTFTNFAQNDQALYTLHAYLMYLKFGFGRATQDAGIEIRRGAMDRDQAINLVKLYDNQYPEIFEQTYLDYYEMSKEEFQAVLDKWANRDLFEKIDGRWMPKFTVAEDFIIQSQATV